MSYLTSEQAKQANAKRRVGRVNGQEAKRSRAKGGAATAAARRTGTTNYATMTEWRPGESPPGPKVCGCPNPLIEIDVERGSVDLLLTLTCQRCGSLRALLRRADLIALRGLASRPKPKPKPPPAPSTPPPEAPEPLVAWLRVVAYRLRLEGLPYETIARALDVSGEQYAHKLAVAAGSNGHTPPELTTRAVRKTCANGHPWTPENTYEQAGGGRRCRTCAAAWARKRAKKPRVEVEAAVGSGAR